MSYKFVVKMGGEGSGNFGHGGRPGERGGSSSPGSRSSPIEITRSKRKPKRIKIEDLFRF